MNNNTWYYALRPLHKYRWWIMSEKNENFGGHLIDDTGLHKSNKKVQITIFVGACRVVTVVLIALGIVALVAGNM